MNYKNIFLKEYDTIDKFIMKASRIFGYSFFVVWFLNLIRVFIVSQKIMNYIGLITIVLMILPTVLFKCVKNKKLVRYIVSTMFIAEICVMYSVLTYHVILMFLFPVVLFIPYGDAKLKTYTIIMSYVGMTVSHLASLQFNVLPEDPFKTLYTVLIYNLTPRLIEFSLFLVVLNFLNRRYQSMLSKLYKYSKETYLTQEEIVRQFAEISESKSGQTGKHVKRVSKYIEIMSQALEIDEQETESLAIASMMHDIGKLMIPSKIIEKPGKLTEEEFAEVKKHTDYGYQLLAKSPGHIMDIAKTIAYQHHERWDGTGYHGIKGEEIDYYSRIMAIVDVFDALISKRSYKEKWTTQEAYDEIVRESGKQFDPHLVDVFKSCYPEFVKISEYLPD